VRPVCLLATSAQIILRLSFLISPQKSHQDLHKLSIQQASICVSEPPDSPLSSTTENPMLLTQQSINSATPSPPPLAISISPGSPPPPNSPPYEEKETLLMTNHNSGNHHPATIAEEQHENEEPSLTNNKSSLSLPVEHSPTMPPPPSSSSTANNQTNNSAGNHKIALPERSQSDRRKLSVTNIMGFGERRRSTSSIFSDMRKMSITNFDSLKSPGIGKINRFLDAFCTVTHSQCTIGFHFHHHHQLRPASRLELGLHPK